MDVIWLDWKVYASNLIRLLYLCASNLMFPRPRPIWLDLLLLLKKSVLRRANGPQLQITASNYVKVPLCYCCWHIIFSNLFKAAMQQPRKKVSCTANVSVCTCMYIHIVCVLVLIIMLVLCLFINVYHWMLLLKLNFVFWNFVVFC